MADSFEIEIGGRYVPFDEAFPADGRLTAEGEQFTKEFTQRAAMRSESRQRRSLFDFLKSKGADFYG